MDPFDWYWWQRGCLITCGYRRSFIACVVDNLVHTQRHYRLIARRRTGWAWLFHGSVEGGRVCDWHNESVSRACEKKWGPL